MNEAPMFPGLIDNVYSLLVPIIKLGCKYEIHDDFWFKCTGKSSFRVLVNCNDLFWWAVADAEEVTEDLLPDLKKAIKDCAKTVQFGEFFGTLLFCCRVRKMRPQNAYYKYINEELWPLFDACGSEREVDFGNPEERPDASQKEKTKE